MRFCDIFLGVASPVLHVLARWCECESGWTPSNSPTLTPTTSPTFLPTTSPTPIPCMNPIGSCDVGTECLNDFETISTRTRAGNNTVLCNDAPINVTQTMTFPDASNVKMSCCDQCDYGCKLQLRDNVDMFALSLAGSGSLTLDGVDFDGNGFMGRAIIIENTAGNFAVFLSNAIVTGFNTQSGAVLSIENGYLSVEDSLIAENDSATGAVRLLISSGNFVRTQFLNNTSTGANYGEAVTVTPSGSNVVVTFENSTFLNNVPNGAPPGSNDIFAEDNGGTAAVACDAATNFNSNNGTGVKIDSNIMGFMTTCRSVSVP